MVGVYGSWDTFLSETSLVHAGVGVGRLSKMSRESDTR
jgi:hypothetical protein